MERLEFYFFCLYNSIYRDGLYLESYLKAVGRGKILPENRVLVGLFFSTWLWTFVLRLIIIIFFRPNLKLLIVGDYEIIIPIIIYAAYYFYFVYNNQFTEIYAKYKSTEENVQKKGLKVVVVFLTLPLVLIPLLILIITKYTDIDLQQFIG
jgi:hypothetical protein